jgi:AraC-like DNA-binding protein
MIPFYGIAPFRLSDSESMDRCAQLGFSDVLADGIDDDLLPVVLERQAFSMRFVTGIWEPPRALALREPMQIAAWRHILAACGRAISTGELARHCGISREHLSRTFARNGAPALKEAIDLVRLLAAGLLSKNPGLDLADVARILGFGSTAQLGRLCRRLLGRPSHSLPRLRAEDVIAIWSSAR